MLKYVYDHMSQGKMKNELGAFCAALDRAVLSSNLSAEVFVKIDTHDASGLRVLHLAAVAKRTRSAASNRRIKHAGWIKLGKVAEPASAIVERLKCEWNNPWLKLIYAFVHQEWIGAFKSFFNFTEFDVTAPVQVWRLVASFKQDITEQAEDDWAALTADNGCVQFAHLQFLPL